MSFVCCEVYFPSGGKIRNTLCRYVIRTSESSFYRRETATIVSIYNINMCTHHGSVPRALLCTNTHYCKIICLHNYCFLCFLRRPHEGNLRKSENVFAVLLSDDAPSFGLGCDHGLHDGDERWRTADQHKSLLYNNAYMI